MKAFDVSFPGGKRVAAHFDGFTVETDQSVRSGGEGAAPQPFDLFFVSICCFYQALADAAGDDVNPSDIPYLLRALAQDGGDDVTAMLEQAVEGLGVARLPDDFEGWQAAWKRHGKQWLAVASRRAAAKHAAPQSADNE